MKQIFPAIALAAFALTSCAQTNSLPAAPKNSDAANGRTLFLKNCAHCHGTDAHGDEGPDLHALDWTDNQIATRIRNGKKGQMTAFAGKLAPDQITTLVVYVRTLK
jgi:mono/diheme cytochrome c family protein